MSSRLVRPGDPSARQAMAWRAPIRGETRVAEPRRAEGATEAEIKREMEARAQAAYQQGFAAGQASGIQQASERIEPAAAALNRIVAELTSVRKKFRADAEQDTVALAIAIARRVLHRELATDPEAILGLVMAAFQKLNARETQRLRLAPSDAALIDEHRARLQFPETLQVIADKSLPPASAVFETSRGEMDASADTQLAEIERGLTDLVRRRTQ